MRFWTKTCGTIPTRDHVGRSGTETSGFVLSILALEVLQLQELIGCSFWLASASDHLFHSPGSQNEHLIVAAVGPAPVLGTGGKTVEVKPLALVSSGMKETQS